MAGDTRAELGKRSVPAEVVSEGSDEQGDSSQKFFGPPPGGITILLTFGVRRGRIVLFVLL